MTLRTKLLAFFTALMASKHAIGTSVITAVTAASISHDWMTWAVSGAGAVAYRLKTPETKKTVAVGNGIISVFLGGLGAPYMVAIVMTEGYPKMHEWLAAFLIALLWPYIWDVIESKWGKK